MKMKIDLHTHCFESTGDSVPKTETVRKIVTQIKKRGLDGIAVTDHDKKDYAFRMKEVVDRYFPDEVLIIPGQEISFRRQHIVELFMPNESVFRFCAHPFFGSNFIEFMEQEADNMHGIEIKNAAWQLQEERIREVAEKHHLIILENSDAHSISEIGFHYNKIDMQILYDRCDGCK